MKSNTKKYKETYLWQIIVLEKLESGEFLGKALKKVLEKEVKDLRKKEYLYGGKLNQQQFEDFLMSMMCCDYEDVKDIYKIK
jgi:hypothetical protein